MRQITVRGHFGEGTYSLGSICIDTGGTITDETRNTVYQVLRRMIQGGTATIWLWDDGTPLLWDDETLMYLHDWRAESPK